MAFSFALWYVNAEMPCIYSLIELAYSTLSFYASHVYSLVAMALLVDPRGENIFHILNRGSFITVSRKFRLMYGTITVFATRSPKMLGNEIW